MIDLTKNISIFILNDKADMLSSGLSSLFNFLSMEYNFLNVSFSPNSGDFQSRINANTNNYKKKINDNLFRVEALSIFYPKKISNQSEFFRYLQELNLITFIITNEDKAADILEDSKYIRTFYKIIDNPNYVQKPFNMNNLKVEDFKFEDRYLFHNINSDEKFTLDQYKIAYRRDKKIDIFLDNNDTK